MSFYPIQTAIMAKEKTMKELRKKQEIECKVTIELKRQENANIEDLRVQQNVVMGGKQKCRQQLNQLKIREQRMILLLLTTQGFF